MDQAETSEYPTITGIYSVCKDEISDIRFGLDGQWLRMDVYEGQSSFDRPQYPGVGESS